MTTKGNGPVAAGPFKDEWEKPMSQTDSTASPMADAAESLAREIVSIAASEDFGDLRTDMIINATMKQLAGDTKTPAPLRVATAIGVITRLGGALEALCDELRSVNS